MGETAEARVREVCPRAVCQRRELEFGERYYVVLHKAHGESLSGLARNFGDVFSGAERQGF